MARRKRNNQIPGYDLTFVTRADMGDDKLAALKERISSIVQRHGGEVIEWQDMGRKKFAYPIEGDTRGVYTSLIFTGRDNVTAEIERNLRINENVIRFLTVQLLEEFSRDAYSEMIQDRKNGDKREEEDYENRRPLSARDQKEEKKLMVSRFARKKECRLCRYDLRKYELDHKNERLLQSFVSEHGRLVPRRISGNSALCQRKLASAIKRARVLGLVPFVTSGTSSHY